MGQNIVIVFHMDTKDAKSLAVIFLTSFLIARVCKNSLCADLTLTTLVQLLADSGCQAVAITFHIARKERKLLSVTIVASFKSFDSKL